MLKIIYYMKLLLTSSSFKGGGIASYAVELINSYAEHFEMSVLIGDDSLYPLDKYGVRVYHYDMADTSEKNAREVLTLVNNVIKPNVVINSCSRLMALLTPFLNNEIKVINVSHSLRYDEADYAGFNSEYADKVVALSGYNKEYLERTFDCRGKVEVVYNFVRELPNQHQLLQNKLKAKTPVIVFTGGGTAAKSPEIIFGIVSKLLKTELNFKFYWMGTTTPPFKKIQPFKDIRDILPNDPRLIITGRIPRDKAIQISNEANIFLTPSRREGCPMALLEAMRVGTIAITSDFDNGCKEIIKDGYNGYVIPHKDLNGFVERIKDIILNHDQYAALYNKSCETFKSELSFDVWKTKMDTIIKHGGIVHKERMNAFNSELYMTSKGKLDARSRYNVRKLLICEYLPSAIHFWKYFLKYKLINNNESVS